MGRKSKIKGLANLGSFVGSFLEKNKDNYTYLEKEFYDLIVKSEIENPWFTQENLFFALKNWSEILFEENIEKWLKNHDFINEPKNIGLVLAGNLPLVGFHDIICAVLSENVPVIKLSSKDKILIPFLMKIWNNFSENNIKYEFVERLEKFDAIIATGSDNTAKYMNYYFREYPRIIRKNRTSLAILTGNETKEELKGLSEDIFRYFGMGCRNITKIFIPENFNLEILFENFINFKHVINHNKYANNYEYNKAIYLLNQEKFWDNGFIMLRECEDLFSPISVVNFSRYASFSEVENFIVKNSDKIQCLVSSEKSNDSFDFVQFGNSQKPNINTYADNIDTMEFLSRI